MFRVQYNLPLMLYTTWDLCLGPSVVHGSMLYGGLSKSIDGRGALWFGRSQHDKTKQITFLNR